MTFPRICMLGLLGLCLPVLAKAQGNQQPQYDYRDGDIVFYSGAGAQSDAIREATRSPYTHCGVLFSHKGQWWVLEAVQPVRSTRLEDFIRRGAPDTFRTYRLKKPLDPQAADRVKAWVEAQIGKDYDFKFLWEDEKLYCSELVWKLYAQAGVKLCAPKTFKEYDLTSPIVKKIIRLRYGDINKLPLEEPVVAPSDIAASNLLAEAPRLKKGLKR